MPCAAPPRSHPTFCFVGVSTGSSSMQEIFPRWMERLGRREVRLLGIDHPLHDDPAAFRRTVAAMKQDPMVLGGLVTTHKMDLFAAARDLFDSLDPHAEALRELSSIFKRGGRLEGAAVEPATIGQGLAGLVGEGYFGRTGGEVLCFGAGGSGAAALLHLLSRPKSADRPRRLVVVDVARERLDQMARLAAAFATDMHIDFVHNHDPAANDRLLSTLPEASLLINATGLGKDRPGSPITDVGRFPHGAVVWELNYRGALDFLHQARRQESAGALRVEDGWKLFVAGWALVLSQVLQVEIPPPLLRELAVIADTVRAAGATAATAPA